MDVDAYAQKLMDHCVYTPKGPKSFHLDTVAFTEKTVHEKLETLLISKKWYADLSLLEEPTFAMKIYRFFIDRYDEQQKEARTVPSFEDRIVSFRELELELTIGVDSEEEYLIDLNKEEVADVSWKSVSRKLEYKDRLRVLQLAPFAKFVYDPTDPVFKKNIDIGPARNIWQINIHKTPKWRGTNDASDYETHWVKEFIDHLFPVESQREMMLDWLYYVITSRTETIPILTGGQGIGKTNFARLIKQLVGPNNFSEAKQDFFSNNFNKFVANKRFVFLDEIEAPTMNNINKLKMNTRENAQIEAKGKDQVDMKIWASFMLSNNYIGAVRVEMGDRRFSIPELSSTKLLDKFDEPWVDRLFNDFSTEDSEAALCLGSYLLERGAKTPKSAVIHGTKFEEAVLKSNANFYEFVVDKMDSLEGPDAKMPLPHAAVAEEFGKRGVGKIPRMNFIQDFFNSWTRNGKQVLKVTKSGRGHQYTNVNNEE